MKLERGDRVAVTVFCGREVQLRFWGLHGKMILVTNDEEYERLSSGMDAPWPVAFRPSEVRPLTTQSEN